MSKRERVTLSPWTHTSEEVSWLQGWSNCLLYLEKAAPETNQRMWHISFIPGLIGINTAMAIILQSHHRLRLCRPCTADDQTDRLLQRRVGRKWTENQGQTFFLSYVLRSNTLMLESLRNFAATRPFLQLTLFVKQDILSFAFGPNILPSF